MAKAEFSIMVEINNIYNDLSPENLTCDGEASRSHVRRAYKRLQKELKKQFKMLGREVSEEESWDWYRKNKKKADKYNRDNHDPVAEVLAYFRSH